MTGSGLFQKAQDATKISKIKEIEEAIKITYMDRKIEEISGGKNVTIEDIVNDLKTQGYIIKKIVSGANRIIGINLDSTEIEMNKNSTKIVSYTLEYDAGKTQYFTEIDGKNYEMTLENDEFSISTIDTDLEKMDTLKGVVSVKSGDSDLIVAETLEDGEIILKSLDTVGNVEITIKEENSNIEKKINVAIKVLAEKLTLSSTQETIVRMNDKKLNVTVEPSDTTDKVEWFSSDESIAKVMEDGTIKGLKKGTAIISAKCGNVVSECSVEVTDGSVSFATLESNGYTLEDFFITTNESVSGGYMEPHYKNLQSLGFRDVPICTSQYYWDNEYCMGFKKF